VHYRSLCSRLAALPAVTTPKQLLDAALRVSAAKAAMAAMRLDGVIRSGGRARGKAMLSSLQSCRDSYASLVDALKSSRTTLRKGGSHDDLMSAVSAAGTYSTDCKDIFAERPELRSPIPGAQRHITRLVSNCIELASTIRQP
jgi:pectinesterase inhibitor-like protein